MMLFTLDHAHVALPLLNWYDRHARELPWRQRWATQRDPYHVWLSEVMLQQTVIKAVLPAYEAFLLKFPRIEDFAEASSEEIRRASKGLGYYRRFDLMHKAAKVLKVKDFTWPTTYEQWRALPGIGPYTAGALSSITLGLAEPAIDGNVERVFCRLLDLREAPNNPMLRPRFKELASKIIDHQRPGDFNQALMELGQHICTKSKPDCQHCPLTSVCMARALGSQELAPKPKIKQQEAIATHFKLVVPINLNEKWVGIIMRGDKTRFLRGSLGFPLSYIVSPFKDYKDNDPDTLSSFPTKPLGSFRHSITCHRIRCDVYASDSLPKNCSWIPWDKAQELLTASLDLKAWSIAKQSLDSTATKTAKRHK